MALNYSGKLGTGEDRPKGLKGGGAIASLKDKVKKKKTTGDSLGEALSKPKTSSKGYRPAASAPKSTGKISGGGKL